MPYENYFKDIILLCIRYFLITSSFIFLFLGIQSAIFTEIKILEIENRFLCSVHMVWQPLLN